MLPRLRSGRIDWDRFDDALMMFLYRGGLILCVVLLVLQLLNIVGRLVLNQSETVDVPTMVRTSSDADGIWDAAKAPWSRAASAAHASLDGRTHARISLEHPDHLTIGDEAQLRVEVVITPLTPSEVRVVVDSAGLTMKPQVNRTLSVSDSVVDVSYAILDANSEGTKRLIASIVDSSTEQVLARTESSISVRHGPRFAGLTQPQLNHLETISKIIGLPGILLLIVTWWFTSNRRKKKARP